MCTRDYGRRTMNLKCNKCGKTFEQIPKDIIFIACSKCIKEKKDEKNN